ncbi:MAG: hypothetical protein OEY00_11370 [Gammaproteobacteria bacterium]|nr:hypothetical protein [Gammaproteobacteria bacterium]
MERIPADLDHFKQAKTDVYSRLSLIVYTEELDMGKPTDDEVHTAIDEAKRMREQGEDPHHLAKVLLNHNYRIAYLDRVMRAAEIYLRSGLSEHEHTELLRAIESAHRADQHSAGGNGLRLVL